MEHSQFFFSKVEQDQLRQYLTKFLNEFLKLKNVSNEVDTIPLVETIINIVPSINIFSFLVTFLINFKITRFIVRKLNFNNIYSFDFLILKYQLLFFLCLIFCLF